MVELHRVVQVAHRLEQAERGHAVLLTGDLRNFEAESHVALPGQVVDLRRQDRPQHAPEGGEVVKVAVMENQL